jgi:hypothetical protein
VAIRVLSTGGLAHSVKLPKLTPTTRHVREGDLAGAIARQSQARVRNGVF